MDPMILSVMYVWCQLNRDTIVSFWFGTQFKAVYLPWVLVGFNLIVKGGGFTELLGIAVGHLYFFLAFKYPQDFNGAQILKTPAILYKYLPSRNNNISGFFGRVPGNNNNNNQPRNLGGRGYVLGRDWLGLHCILYFSLSLSSESVIRVTAAVNLIKNSFVAFLKIIFVFTFWL